MKEWVFMSFLLPQVVAHDGSGLGAPEDAAGDDRRLHQDLVAGGQGFLGFPWTGKFPEVFRVRGVKVEGRPRSSAYSPFSAPAV